MKKAVVFAIFILVILGLGVWYWSTSVKPAGDAQTAPTVQVVSASPTKVDITWKNMEDQVFFTVVPNKPEFSTSCFSADPGVIGSLGTDPGSVNEPVSIRIKSYTPGTYVVRVCADIEGFFVTESAPFTI